MKIPLLLTALTLTNASAVEVFQGDGLGGNVDYFLAPGNWASGAPPIQAASDIVAKSDFMLDGERVTFPAKSLTLDAGLNGFIARGELVVEGDVDVPAGRLEVQRQAVLKWSGVATIGGTRSSRLMLVGGLRDDSTPRLQGGSLAIEADSILAFRWIKAVPAGLPENVTPLVESTGPLVLGPGSRITFALEEFGDPVAEVPAGDYLLVRASEIKGELPELTPLALAEPLIDRLSLAFTDDKRGILLRVAAP